jgi:hypothetical protein
MRFEFHLPLLVLLLFCTIKAYSVEVIAVDPVRILPSVVEQSQSAGQRLHLERFQESLERTCQEELKRSGRHKVVARRDLQKLLDDLKLGSSGLFKSSNSGVGNFTANTKLLILSINQFSFAKVEKKFEELGRQVSRIEIFRDGREQIFLCQGGHPREVHNDTPEFSDPRPKVECRGCDFVQNRIKSDCNRCIGK